MATIYNTTDGPLAIDRAGRVLGGRERLEVDNVDSSPLAGHVRDGRILVLDDVVDEAQVEDDTTPDEQPARKAGRRTPTNEEA